MNLTELQQIAEQYKDVNFDKTFTVAEMHDGYKTYIKNIQGRKIRLGIPSFDNALGMIRPSQLVTFVGGTNTGKTALAMHIGLSNALLEKMVVFFNLEIDENEIYERLLQREFNLTTAEVEKAFLNNQDEQFKKVGDIYANFISVIGRVDVDNIIPYVKSLENLHQKEAGLVIVDYLGLLTNKLFREEYMRITDNMTKLKEIALHLRIPVINLSQTSRADIKGTDKELGLNSGKGSGEVENSTQILIALNIMKKDKCLSEQIPNSIIERADNNEIYIVKAVIHKKKQGDYAETYLMFNKKSLNITEFQKAEFYEQKGF